MQPLILFSLFLLIVEFCFFICVSKNLLTTKGYCLFIIFLSTTALAQFSQIFTIYYIHIRAAFELPAMGVSTVADEIYEISGDSLLVDTFFFSAGWRFRYCRVSSNCNSIFGGQFRRDGFEVKKNRSLGVFEEIKRISVSFVILAFIGMMALLFTMDAGCNYTNIQDYGHMDFYTDYFTINGFDTGSIIISASGIDEEKTSIAEEDIILQGFTAETSITYLSKEEGNVFCVIRLSNMESASDLDEKTISLKEGVISVEDKASPSVTLRGLGNKFVSMREYTVYCILFFSLYNILFLFNASILDGGGIASSVLLWIESLAYEGPIV